MGILFGKSSKKQSRITEQDQAVLELKKQRDKLKQYQKKITVQLEKDRQVAKKLLGDGKKDKALSLLKKKKFQESLLSKTDAQLDNIDNMVNNIEFAQVETKVLEGLKQGNSALEKMHKLMSLDDVEKIMDDTREAVEYQREIDELLSGGLSQTDEDDVLAELDSIVQESLPSVPAADIELPDVPTGEPTEAEKAAHKKQAVLAS